jgi:hypothetical protein
MENELKQEELAPDVAPAAAGGGDDGDDGLQNELREMAREALAQHGALHPALAHGKNNPAWNAFRAQATALIRGGESVRANHTGKVIEQKLTTGHMIALRAIFDEAAKAEE